MTSKFRSKSEQKRIDIQSESTEEKKPAEPAKEKSSNEGEETVKLRLMQNFYIGGVFHKKDSVITLPKSVADKRLKETTGVFAQDVSEKK